MNTKGLTVQDWAKGTYPFGYEGYTFEECVGIGYSKMDAIEQVAIDIAKWLIESGTVEQFAFTIKNARFREGHDFHLFNIASACGKQWLAATIANLALPVDQTCMLENVVCNLDYAVDELKSLAEQGINFAEQIHDNDCKCSEHSERLAFLTSVGCGLDRKPAQASYAGL